MKKHPRLRADIINTERLKESKAREGLRGIWIWGESNTGRSTEAKRIAQQTGEDIYYVRPEQLRFWDGYTGQRTIILEDFDLTWCPEKTLKMIMERGEVKLNIKGSFTWACWTTVIVVTTKDIFETGFERPHSFAWRFMNRMGTKKTITFTCQTGKNLSEEDRAIESFIVS